MFLYESIISFIIAFLVSFLATPLAKRLSYKIGAVDIPKDDRRIHKKPVPRLGGVAIVSGFFVALLFNIICMFLNLPCINIEHQVWGLITGVALIVLTGMVDDIRPLSSKSKLFLQIIAALIVIIVSDIRILTITNPFSNTGVSELSIFISYPLTILWIVGITNAVNLIDGLDGLAAGVSSIAYLSLFFISVILGNSYAAILTVILAGATLGFLPYNFNPAKIFMGDTGSNFLGFTLGVISIHETLKSYTAVAIAIPLLVLGLPIFDTLLAILRRVLKNKPIMEADRGHLHHRLLDMGLTHKQSVIIMYVTSAALGLCGIVLANKGALSAIIIFVVLFIFIIIGGHYMTESDKNNEKYETKVPTNEKINDEGNNLPIAEMPLNKELKDRKD